MKSGVFLFLCLVSRVVSDPTFTCGGSCQWCSKIFLKNNVTDGHLYGVSGASVAWDVLALGTIHQTIHDESGNVVVGGYTTGYGNNQFCSYMITADEDIVFKPLTVNMEAPHDFVKVYSCTSTICLECTSSFNGILMDSTSCPGRTELAVYTGAGIVPSSVTSTTGFMQIVFQTDPSVDLGPLASESGFQAIVEVGLQFRDFPPKLVWVVPDDYDDNMRNRGNQDLAMYHHAGQWDESGYPLYYENYSYARGQWNSNHAYVESQVMDHTWDRPLELHYGSIVCKVSWNNVYFTTSGEPTPLPSSADCPECPYVKCVSPDGPDCATSPDPFFSDDCYDPSICKWSPKSSTYRRIDSGACVPASYPDDVAFCPSMEDDATEDPQNCNYGCEHQLTGQYSACVPCAIGKYKDSLGSGPCVDVPDHAVMNYKLPSWMMLIIDLESYVRAGASPAWPYTVDRYVVADLAYPASTYVPCLASWTHNSDHSSCVSCQTTSPAWLTETEMETRYRTR